MQHFFFFLWQFFCHLPLGVRDLQREFYSIALMEGGLGGRGLKKGFNLLILAAICCQLDCLDCDRMSDSFYSIEDSLWIVSFIYIYVYTTSAFPESSGPKS
jgi:hypothetical protein